MDTTCAHEDVGEVQPHAAPPLDDSLHEKDHPPLHEHEQPHEEEEDGRGRGRGRGPAWDMPHDDGDGGGVPHASPHKQADEDGLHEGDDEEAVVAPKQAHRPPTYDDDEDEQDENSDNNKKKKKKKDEEEAFYRWLAQNGLDVNCSVQSKIRLATFPTTGRGTCATVPIHEEDLLVGVPARVILSVRTAQESLVVKEVLPMVQGTILADPIVALALILLHEKHNPASFWAPYFHILIHPLHLHPFHASILSHVDIHIIIIIALIMPWSYVFTISVHKGHLHMQHNVNVWFSVYIFYIYPRAYTGFPDDPARMLPSSYNIPIFWPHEDVEPLKEAHTDIIPHVRNMRASLLRLYFGCLIPLFHERPDLFSPKVHTFEELMWAFATIWSRGYWLDNNDTIPAIVPFADMLNHHTENGGELVAHYFYDEQASLFRVIAKTSYLTGQEVFTHYGNKANQHFLEEYGFIFKGNPQNEFVLPIPSFVTQHLRGAHIHHLRSLLLLRNIPYTDKVLMKGNQFPTGVCNLFRAYLLSPAQLCEALGLPPVETFPPSDQPSDPSDLASTEVATYCSVATRRPELEPSLHHPHEDDGEESHRQDAQQSNDAPAADADGAKVTFVVDEQNEMAAYDLFSRCCDHWLSEYSTSKEEDEAFMADPTSPPNARMVRMLLYEEKRAIVYLQTCFVRMAEYVRAHGIDWEAINLLSGEPQTPPTRPPLFSATPSPEEVSPAESA